MRKIWRHELALAVSGFMVVLNFAPNHWWELIWFCLVPALLVATEPEWKAGPGFLSGYVFGLVYFGGSLWWIGHVTVLGMCALCCYLAIYPGLWFWAMTRAWGNVRWNFAGSLGIAVAGASLWVVLDWVRSWLFTGFNWNYLGVALVGNVPLMQLAKVGGVYLMTWLVVFVNVLIARGLGTFRHGPKKSNGPRPFLELYGALAAVALCATWGFKEAMKIPPGAEKRLKYVCVQPNVPQNAFKPEMAQEDILEAHFRLTEVAALARPELIIWPEATTGADFTKDPVEVQPWRNLHLVSESSVIMGSMEYEDEESYNDALFFAKGSDVIEAYRKNVLVIFGEYTPLAQAIPAMRKLVPFSSDLSRGVSPAAFVMPGSKLRLSPLICFEDSLPNFVRHAAGLEPDVLINITNDSWFYNSPGPAQHLQNATLRTVENGVPMIRCGNTGVTCEIDALGVIRRRLISASDKSSGLGEEGLMQHEMVWRTRKKTPYQRYGDWVVGLSALICVGAIFRLKRNLASK